MTRANVTGPIAKLAPGPAVRTSRMFLRLLINDLRGIVVGVAEDEALQDIETMSLHCLDIKSMPWGVGGFQASAGPDPAWSEDLIIRPGVKKPARALVLVGLLFGLKPLKPVPARETVGKNLNQKMKAARAAVGPRRRHRRRGDGARREGGRCSLALFERRQRRRHAAGG